MMKNEEFERIKAISDTFGKEKIKELLKKSPYNELDNEKSYFLPYNQKSKHIIAYEADSAMDWKNVLEKLWENEIMKKEYILPVTVAVMKNRGIELTEQKVSAFIYEF